MKHIITLTLSLTLHCALFAQNVPIDFETGGNGADWTWSTFENDDNPALEIVANPDKTGANTSETVAKFTSRPKGNPWAGCETKHGTDIGEYKIESTNSIITIMVYKTLISDVGIKLVTNSSWSKGELKVANTVINQWEKLTFDFSTINHENMTYDQIVIFPDFKNREQDNISYFDNITIGSRDNASTSTISSSINSIYPNPTNGNVVLPKETLSYGVYNTSGQLVAAGDQSRADITDLSPNIYYVEIMLNDGTVHREKIVKH